MWKQLCPRCRQGAIHRSLMSVHPNCPVCGLRFQREQGYFLGAMYASYALSAPVLTVLFLVLWRITGLEWNDQRLLGVTALAFLPLVLPIVRVSRVIWIYIDRHFDPE